MTGWLVLVALAIDAPVAVAVFPFQDLSGSASGIGEGIRETVALDLREHAGLRVVERAELDRVLTEQKLTAPDDAKDTARVGKLVGADLLVLGAYQRVGGRVRLTARFVRTATAEIVGTAKVDGREAELLSLQDRICAELLRTAGLKPISKRERPLLESLEPVDLFGKASAERSEAMRRALLAQLVRQSPQFPFASEALRALEARLKTLAATTAAAQAERLTVLERELAAAKGLEERTRVRQQLSALLFSMRRSHTQLALWTAAAEELATDTSPQGKQAQELAHLERVLALQRLRRREELLKEGEAFLTRWPAAVTAPAVRALLGQTLGELKAEQEGQAHAVAPSWDLCAMGAGYARHAQHQKALRLFDACAATGVGERERALQGMLEASIALAQWPLARTCMASLEAEAPVAFERVRVAYEYRVPTDG